MQARSRLPPYLPVMTWQVLYKHEAAFKHFVQMGHGGLAVTGFGLPPFTLKPAACARRAVAAGCDVRAKLAQVPHRLTLWDPTGPPP